MMKGIDEAVRLAGVGRTLIYQEITEGRLRIRKAGRRTLITITDLTAWLMPAQAGEHQR